MEIIFYTVSEINGKSFITLAEHMHLEDALLFIEAYMHKYYAEPLSIVLSKEMFEEDTCMEGE